MDIFNPTLCLARQLKDSWSANLLTESNAENKVPIEVAEGVPRLKIIHDTNSSEDWCACAVPIQSTWDPVDISEFKTLALTVYREGDSGGVLRLVDDQDNESQEFNLHGEGLAGEEHMLEIDLSLLSNLEPTRVKLIKIIGYKGSAFYISEVYLK